MVTRDPMLWVSRLWSLLVLAAFAAKVRLWWTLSQTANAAAGWTPPVADPILAGLATQFVWPEGLPLWQFASAINAAAAWGVYFYAARLRLLAEHEVLPEAALTRRFNRIEAIRTAITVYVIGSTLYLLVTTAADLDVPVLDILIFPWSERPIRLFDG